MTPDWLPQGKLGMEEEAMRGSRDINVGRTLKSHDLDIVHIGESANWTRIKLVHHIHT